MRASSGGELATAPWACSEDARLVAPITRPIAANVALRIVMPSTVLACHAAIRTFRATGVLDYICNRSVSLA
jgi:hypothetical protein